MRFIVLLCAILMPLIAYFSQQGSFGPDNGTISNQYPTLLVAAGYAFSIWGLIFLLDIAFGTWQAFGSGRGDATIARARPAIAGGFLLTALWMPVFSQQIFWLALLIIWASFALLAYVSMLLSRGPLAVGSQRVLAWGPVSLHAGWLALAAFLNTAQVIVAYRILPTDNMLGWSLVLFALAAAVLLFLNFRMRGNPAFVAAALWGFAAVYVKQSGSALAGADIAAWTAVAITLMLAVQTAWLRLRAPRAAG